MAPVWPPQHLTGVRGRIWSAYTGALNALGNTGVTAAPHTTLRDSLKSAASLPPAAREAFTELTRLAETALYSEREPDEVMAKRAEELAGKMRPA